MGTQRCHVKERTLFRVDDAERVNARSGSGWYAGRLHDGDLLLFVRKSGDCFGDYMLIEGGQHCRQYPSQLMVLRPTPMIWEGYEFGGPSIQLPQKEYHLLLSGDCSQSVTLHPALEEALYGEPNAEARNIDGESD